LFLILAPVARVGPLKAQRAPLNRPSSVERRVSSVTSTSAATSPATAPVLYPASPSQGDTLFVLVRGAGNVSCTWDGRSVPVARTGDASVATIGIRVDERTGSHNLVLKNTEADGTLHSEKRSVAVRRTAWPVQYLKMKRSTERLYTFPGAKAEDAAVTTATRTFSPTSLWRGAFLVPTNGRRSTPFGVKRIRNGRKPYYHRGVDLAAPTGTPVVAPNAGRVALARVFKKYGKTVVLDHGLGVTTLYLHMSALAVHEGETVQRGQLIGKVGMEGVATGPHLHWSLYVHGNSVSPLFWTRLPAAVLGLTR
jgi:murein DD-endopeptidase MepM/ murein hydrolase activator NlpD